MSVGTERTAVPPSLQLVQMATGYWVSRVLWIAAHLGIADLLAGGAKSADQLAAATKTHAPSLYRVMRTLAGLGVLTEDAQHRFSLTELGEAMRTGAPGGARAAILTVEGEAFRRTWDEILYSIQTGKPSFDRAFGKPIFDWLGEHPAEASLFSETMIGIHGTEPAAVADAYDFSGFSTLVDVGGATGHLLTTVLAKHRGPRGVLYDLPHVVREAPPLIRERGLEDRITIESGSFFESVPAGGDAYVLSHIIHDWTEGQCVRILDNVRNAMTPNGKVLLVEMVLPSGDTFHPGKLFDIMMLVGPGGQERTEAEYADLFGKAGLRLTRVVPTESAVSVVEGVRA